MAYNTLQFHYYTFYKSERFSNLSKLHESDEARTKLLDSKWKQESNLTLKHFLNNTIKILACCFDMVLICLSIPFLGIFTGYYSISILGETPLALESHRQIFPNQYKTIKKRFRCLLCYLQ